MSKIVGLDLGTGNSCIAVFEGGSPTVIVNSEGKRTTPSVIGFTNDDKIKVGDSAKRQAVTNPKNTVLSIKRFMGNTYKECEDEATRVQYDVVDEGGYPRVDIKGKKYTPQELSAMIIQKMKKSAEDYLGEPVKDIVITVPAYFGDAQRQATKEAGEIAGLNVRRIINEPTAAALAYGLDKSDKDRVVAVIDDGCGTYDVSILSFGGGVFEVLSTAGNTHLGGDDFDQVIIDWLVDEFMEDENFDLSKDPMAMQRLKEAAEKAKIELSNTTSTELNLPYITSIDGTPKHFIKTLTRAKFEQLSSDLIKQHIEPIKNALKSAKIEAKDVDEAILVGGTTRIPAIQNLVKEIFGKEPSKGVNPDEAVALGAAIQGAILNKDAGVGDIVLLYVTPLNLGIETMGGVMTTLIPANTTIPCDKEETFSTAADNQTVVTIKVCQGNRSMANDNKQIGLFNLEGILPAMRGVPQIGVKFSIDSNGILTVTAKDKGTGKEQKIRIESKSSLSKEEIERMKSEAEANADADKKAKEEADTINKGDSIVFGQKQMLNEQKDNINADEKTKLESLVSEMETAVKERNVERINSIETEINSVWQGISQRIYAKNEQSSNSESQSKTNDTVEDANFEEVK